MDNSSPSPAASRPAPDYKTFRIRSERAHAQRTYAAAEAFLAAEGLAGEWSLCGDGFDVYPEMVDYTTADYKEHMALEFREEDPDRVHVTYEDSRTRVAAFYSITEVTGALGAAITVARTARTQVDFEAVFDDDDDDRQRAQGAFTSAQQMLAGAGVADQFVLADPAMVADRPWEVRFVSLDAAAVLCAVQLTGKERFLVFYDGLYGDWAKVFSATGEGLAEALASRGY